MHLNRLLIIGLLCLTNSLTFGLTDSTRLKSYQNKLRELRYTKHLDSVVYYFNLVSPLALQKNDSVALFWAHKSLGDAYEHHQHLDSTLHHYKICEKLIPTTNHSLKSFLLGDKAYTYKLLYDYDKSTELSLQALDEAYLAGDSNRLVSSLLNVATDFADLDLNKQATYYFTNAIGTATRAGNNVMLEYSLRFYAKFLLETSEWKKSYVYLKRTASLALLNSDSISLAFNWFHLSSYFWQAKQLDSCFYFGKKAEKIWEARAEKIDLSHVCYHLGKCYLELGKLPEATHYLLKAEQLALGDIYFNEPLYTSIAELYNKKNQGAKAYLYLQKAKELSEQIREKEKSGKLAGLQIKYHSEEKEALINKQKKETEQAKSEATKSTYQRNTIFFVTLGSLLFSVVVIYLNRKINIKNHQLLVTNSALVRSTEQKQILLKEVHHRVKNNLTTLKSLFYLQAKSSNNQEVKQALEDCQQQIHSMALIHQNMYEATETEKLDFFNFLKQLMSELEASSLPSGIPIQISYQGEGVDLDVSTALFLSLMVNELATNSFKHAFVGRNQGKIKISLKRFDTNLELKFTDDGIGLPGAFGVANGNFGFMLLHIMADQVNATMTYLREHDFSVFSIEVPYENKV